MSRMKTVLAFAALAVALAVPATASAGSTDVKNHLKKADKALAKAESLVSGSDDAAAALAMARANVQTHFAGDDATGSGDAKKVAFQWDQNVETYLDLIPEVAGSHQDEVSGEITEAVDGREHAVATLTELLDQVPESAVTGITNAIVAIQTGVPQDLVSMTSALGSGAIDPQAMESALAALDSIRKAVDTAVAQLQSVLDQVPPEAQAHVQHAIEQIQAQVSQALQQLETVLGDLPIPPGLPIPSGLPVPGGSPFGN
jgi:hypothetical protein